MTDFKKTKKTEKIRGLAFVEVKTIAKPSAYANHVAGRSAKTGRFADGVKIVSKRDRDGLIKLADR